VNDGENPWVKDCENPQRERAGAIQPELGEKSFRILVPGYEWRTFWDSFLGPNKTPLPDECVASVSYDWDYPEKHEAYEVHFDVKSLIGKMWLEEATLEDSLQAIAEAIRGLADEGLPGGIAETPIAGPLQEIARSVKGMAATLQRQTKAMRR
jgi:hypothetical protein